VITDSPAPGSRLSAKRQLLTIGAVTLMLGAIAWYLLGRSAELAAIRRLSVPVLLTTVMLQFLSSLAFNEATRLPLLHAMRTLGFWEFYAVRTGGLFAGTLLPLAGNIALRLAYLRTRGLTYVDFTWGTIVSNVMALVASSALAAAATLILWARAGRPADGVLWLAAAGLGASAVAMLLLQRLPMIAAHRRLAQWRWISVVSGVSTPPALAVRVFSVSLVRHVLNFVTFGVLYQSLSQATGELLTGGLVYALTSPVRMVNITPGNVGVNEWVTAAIGKTLAFDVTSGLLVAMVFRGLGIVAQALGVLVGGIMLRPGGETR
jgi:hypothetical protein